MSDSHQHVVKTSAQWNERAIEYWIVPRGCLCVELTARGKTKLKVGEGNKNYYQLPYICDHEDLSDYYTKEEIDNLFNNLNRMAIMSTDEYDSRSDLPRNGNKLGDVRFVKSQSPSIKIDPDLYVWNGTKWIFVGSPFDDISQFVTRDEFNVVKDKVDEIYPKAHTHSNKPILDSITQEDREKFDSLHNYDDTEIRHMIEEGTHTHPNKPVLDQITQQDLDKLDSLHNYDDTEIKHDLFEQQVSIDVLEAKAHTHSNKRTLDRITDEMVDNLDTFAQCCFEIKNDIRDLKDKSHVHQNKDILDLTTASYTLEDKQILYDLYHIGAFLGAGPTWDGTLGYVPAPIAGYQNYFLRGDGTWSKVKTGGDKYKAGEGIYILSGEVATETFPFKVYSKSAKLKQYVIYGAQGGVGTLVSSNPNVYSVPLTITSPDYGTRQTNILISDPLYAGDYIDYQRQVFVHTRTVLPTSEFPVDPARAYRQGVYADGRIEFYYPGGGYADNPVVSLVYEFESGASYEFPPGSSNFPDWQWNALGGAMNINLYDANMNRTRTVGLTFNNTTIVTPTASEKYMIFGGIKGTDMCMAFPRITKIKDVETPCVLQEVILYANTINTIDVDTSVKPSEMYVEVDDPPEDQPDDPLSNYTGIIYNDGVLDITQEDPNALNELTVHFRDAVDKTITIPPSVLEPATTETLGGIIVGDNLTIDENGVLSAEAGGNVYYAGDGIEIETDTVTTYEDLHFDYYAFKDKVHSVLNGSVSFDDTTRSITLNATSNYCYTKPYISDTTYHDGDAYGPIYEIPVLPNEDYLLTWTVDNPSVAGKIDVFENGNIDVEHHGGRTTAGEQQYLFTTTSTAETINFRPYVYDSNTSITYTDFKLYHVTYDTSAKTINAKLGDGLSFDSNDAITVDEMTGATALADGTSGIVPAPLTGDENKFLRGDGTWDTPDIAYTAGTGIDIGGSIIYNKHRAIPSDQYREVLYIESDGTNYIMTDIRPASDTAYQLFWESLDLLDLSTQALVGTDTIVNGQHRNSAVFYEYYNNTVSFAMMSGNDSAVGTWATSTDSYLFNSGQIVNSAPGQRIYQVFTCTYNNAGGYSNTTVRQTSGVDYAAKTNSQPFAIFGANTYDSDNDTHDVVNRSKYRYHWFVLFRGNQIATEYITHVLYPCYRLSDNRIGVYDVNTNVFYPANSNVGFTLGADLVDIVPDTNNTISAKIGRGLTVDSVYGNITNAGVVDIEQNPSQQNQFTVEFVDSSRNKTITIPTGGGSDTTYTDGKGITFTQPGLIDLGFDFDAFVAKISSIHNGTKIVDLEHETLALTATGADCFTYPYSNTSAQYVYTLPIVAGHVYRLTWDSSDPSVSGNVFAFENVSETNLHLIDQAVQDYLEFTAVTSGTVNFRFGVANSGTTISYSNIHFYEVDNFDPNTNIINADIAKGLEFNSLDKLQVKLGDGLHFDANDAIELDSNLYYPGQGIEFGGETLIPTEFNQSEFINVISAINGTISKSPGLDSFTLTASANDCFTDHYDGWNGYYITAEPNTKYRVSWESANGTIGNMFVFEVSGTSYTGVMYIVGNDSTNVNIFTTSNTCTKLSLRFGVANAGDSETYSNITFDKVVPLSNVITAKLGDGLQFDANGAIEVTSSGGNNYRAGDGIEITTIYPPQQGFQVEDTDYYFDTNVQCTIGGRIYTKYTTDPALGVICHARVNSGGGQSTVYSGPMFFGLSENAVKVHNDYSGGQIDGSMGTFEYKGYTWYISAHNYMNDGTTIVDGGIPRIDDLVFTFDGNGEIELGKMVIDLAGLITDPIDEFSAKLGDGLSFDNNNAITNTGLLDVEQDQSDGHVLTFSTILGDVTITIPDSGGVYEAGNGIQFIPSSETDMHFNYTAFANSITGVYNGTLVKNNDDSFTMTPNNNTGSWTYPDLVANGAYSMSVTPETNYKLTWDCSDDSVVGAARVFENGQMTNMYYDLLNKHELRFTTTNSCNSLSFRFEITDTNPVTISNINLYKLEGPLTSIEAKLGNGLHFDANGAIEIIPGVIPEYEAGQGIIFSNDTTVINAGNQAYYFESMVTCRVEGTNYQRTFNKSTAEPALGAIITVRDPGNNSLWTGPVFVGLTQSSARNNYNNNAVNGPLVYKDMTWYSSKQIDWADGELSDISGNLQKIPGIFVNSDVDGIAKAIINAANLIFNKAINAKLGNGLHFDANGAIEADANTLTASHGVEIVSDDIEANLGAGLILDQNDAITLDETTKFTLYCNNDPD